MARDFRPGAGGHRETARAGARTAEPRISLYAEVTGRIISELEAGRFPWVQPWAEPAKVPMTGTVIGKPVEGASAACPGLPRNAVSGRTYSGINVLLLWGAVIQHGHPSQGWLTFRQALDAGGHVRADEKGITVCYADRFTPDAEKLRAAQTGDDPKTIPFLKRFVVFNVAQVDGLPERLTADPPPLPTREIVPVVEDLIAASGADFRIGGAEAFYSPSGDYVQVPPQPAFRDQINYYRTALHELGGHWTGHKSRLNRDLSGRFGSADYAREELIAELASAYLCASLGIAPTVRHADYLGHWLAVLRADNRVIFKAASQASKAADYLLAFQRQPYTEQDMAA